MATTGAKYATSYQWANTYWHNPKNIVSSNLGAYGYISQVRTENEVLLAGFDLSSIPSKAVVTSFTLKSKFGAYSTSAASTSVSFNIGYNYVAADDKTGTYVKFNDSPYYFVNGVKISKDRVEYTASSTSEDSDTLTLMSQNIDAIRSGAFCVEIVGSNCVMCYVSVDIEYSIPKATISTSVLPSNGGTVTGSGQYETGSSVTLTATPSTGYHFVQWQDGNTSSSRTITVSGDATYTATFALNSYSISTAVAPSGSGSVSGGGTYDHGANATLTATPATGYQFVKWSDNNTSNPRSVTVTESATYTATFALKSYVVSTAVSPSGSGTVTGAGTYNHGSTATLTATPATGYEFVKWSDNNTSSSRTVTVTAAATYTATFQLKTYTIYLTDDDGNSLGSVTATHGSSPVITTTPTKQPSGGATYTFREWNTQRDGSGTSYPLNGLPAATGSTTYFAQFDATYSEPDIASITVAPNPATGGQGVVITVVFET